MNRAMLRRLINTDFQNLLDALSSRQHLSPHERVSESLARTVEKLGVCPQAIEKAVAWLQIDPSISVGRLRRTELMQLARSIHRLWRQQPSNGSPAPQPK